MLPVPLQDQPALLAAYLADQKTRGPLLASAAFGIASSIAASYAVAEITPEEDDTKRVLWATGTGLASALLSILFLANRAEHLRQARGGSSSWV